MMRPRTIVDYEREPWVYDFGTVRLTFDQNVRVAVGSFDILIQTYQQFQSLIQKRWFSKLNTQSICQRLSRVFCQGKADMMAVSKVRIGL